MTSFIASYRGCWPGNPQQTGVFLLQLAKPTGFVGVGIAVLLLPDVVRRGAAPELAAKVFGRPLAFFAFLEQFDDLVFGKRRIFADWASLAGAGVTPKTRTEEQGMSPRSARRLISRWRDGQCPDECTAADSSSGNP